MLLLKKMKMTKAGWSDLSRQQHGVRGRRAPLRDPGIGYSETGHPERPEEPQETQVTMDNANSTLFPSSNSSSHPSYQCHGYRISVLMISGYSVSNVLLLLPLNTWVLWLGTRPTTTPTTKPLTALLTSNMAALEIFCSLVSVLRMLGFLLEAGPLLTVGTLGTAFIVGRPLFHCCLCLERYLAVLRPLAYLRLRASRYRGLVPALVWLLVLGYVAAAIAYWPRIPVAPVFAVFLFSTLVMCFCSLAVLKALIGPGPGDGGGDREGRSELKKRAFQTIVLIFGAVLVSFVAFLAGLSMMLAGLKRAACVALDSGFFLTFPSSVVQPLLFLHGAGKLPRLCHAPASTPEAAIPDSVE